MRMKCRKSYFSKRKHCIKFLYIIASIEEVSKSFLLILISEKLKAINLSSSSAISFSEVERNWIMIDYFESS